MRKLGFLFLPALILTAASDVSAMKCEINFISHGTIGRSPIPGEKGDCVEFVDDLGNRYEITNPKHPWRDGMGGLVIAQWETEGSCTSEQAIKICSFDADFDRKINGTLIITQFVECPGYTIRTPKQDWLIRNCSDFWSGSL